VRLDGYDATFLSLDRPDQAERVSVCIRPEHVMVSAADDQSGPGDGPATRLPATIEVASFLGNHVRYLLSGPDGLHLHSVSNDTETIQGHGSRVTATILAANAQLLGGSDGNQRR
jgi:hypothetical protein